MGPLKGLAVRRAAGFAPSVNSAQSGGLDGSITLRTLRFLPLLGVVGLGAICATVGMFAARRVVVGAVGEAVPRIAVQVLAIGALGFGLAAMVGLAPVGTPPLVIMTSLFAGFVTLAVSDLSRRNGSAALSKPEASAVAGSIAGPVDRRHAA
jgi:hypothetical protein